MLTIGMDAGLAAGRVGDGDLLRAAWAAPCLSSESVREIVMDGVWVEGGVGAGRGGAGRTRRGGAGGAGRMSSSSLSWLFISVGYQCVCSE